MCINILEYLGILFNMMTLRSARVNTGLWGAKTNVDPTWNFRTTTPLVKEPINASFECHKSLEFVCFGILFFLPPTKENEGLTTDMVLRLPLTRFSSHKSCIRYARSLFCVLYFSVVSQQYDCRICSCFLCLFSRFRCSFYVRNKYLVLPA